MFKVWIKLGWDKTYYRTKDTVQECEQWLDSQYKKYLPSQIVASAIIEKQQFKS